MSDVTLRTSSQEHEAQTTDRTTFGFWVYLMTDFILFASLFATYVVLRDGTAGGPSGREIFDLPFVLVETLILLTSSFTCGLAMLCAHRRDKTGTLVLFGITFALGAAFLAMELTEFTHLVLDGHSWRESAFLSAFFTLVGTHGLHITAGLLWIITMSVQVMRYGLDSMNMRRLTMLSLFWHFLDIIWIFIFTVVYLMGAV